MCWTNKKAEKKIANKDIEVFKIGHFRDNMFCSLFLGFYYQLNQLYSTNIHIKVGINNKIEGTQGFHSYNSSIVKLEVRPCAWYIYFRAIMLDCCFISNNFIKAECIIPKGSEYYENNMGEIISNQIVIKNVIPINQLCKM